MQFQNTVSVFTDGGARGNPGPAAIGVYIEKEGKPLIKIGKRIGETTNNVAEYSAILQALTWIEENKEKVGNVNINFFMDSELAFSQLTGLYKIKNENIKKLIAEIKKKEAAIGLMFTYAHIRREKNKEADKLVNLALDNII
ncbi:MAG TPA: ribonuclease HI family protein [Patescibacteria group bacterium]|nr:ribonuclease HI family protein [Patescibacteria group bacterium]